MSDYIRVSVNHIAHRPENITPIEAAGITLAAQTAYQSVFEAAKLKPGQTVFVYGGSTSVGAFAIQIAKSMGCRVVASASGKNEAMVRGLGADEVCQ